MRICLASFQPPPPPSLCLACFTPTCRLQTSPSGQSNHRYSSVSVWEKTEIYSRSAAARGAQPKQYPLVSSAAAAFFQRDVSATHSDGSFSSSPIFYFFLMLRSLLTLSAHTVTQLLRNGTILAEKRGECSRRRQRATRLKSTGFASMVTVHVLATRGQ